MTTPDTPGVHEIPEEEYHRHPALSASGAKKLLPPSCPARFAWERDHPATPTAAMELGIAVHKLVLGKGADVVHVEADSWRTTAAKDKAKDARAAGHIPLLTDDLARAETVAAAVHAHPVAAALLDMDHGSAEQSLFWLDREGVQIRARLDYLPHGRRNGRFVIADLKTCASAEPGAIAKAVANLRYDIQAANYIDGVAALGLDPDPAFVFVFVETSAPYPVTVAQLRPQAVENGRAAMRRAIEVYRDCTDAGLWPAYTTDIEQIELPPWALRDLEYA